MSDNLLKDLFEDSPLSMSEKISRRRSDVQLPNSGKPDPRIKRKTPDVMEGLRRAGEGLQQARKVFGKDK